MAVMDDPYQNVLAGLQLDYDRLMNSQLQNALRSMPMQGEVNSLRSLGQWTDPRAMCGDDYKGLAKTRRGYMLGFPRSKCQQERRMERFMEWRQRQRKERLYRIIGAWACVLVGPPVAVAAYAWLWKFAFWAVLN
jgi:hypothetical protein